MHATALQYAVDSLVSTQDGLDRDMVTRILRAGVDLYTTWFGDPDVADLRQKISAAHIDSGFTREKASAGLRFWRMAASIWTYKGPLRMLQ